MNKLKLSLAVLLSLTIFFIAGCAVSDKNDDIDSLLSELSSFYAEEPDDSLFRSSPNYTLILPNGCSAEVLDAAALLSQTMSKYVGYSVAIEYDTDAERSSDIFEIIIGRTSRKESRSHLNSLRTDDYGYSVYKSALCIGAHRDKELCLAIKMLVDDIENQVVSLMAISNAESRAVRGEYAVDEFKLNGFPLSEYSIVYPHGNENGELRLANILARSIEESFDYTLEVTNDLSAPYSARKLCIGSTIFSNPKHTPGASVAAIYSNGATIEFSAADNYGLGCAVSNFHNMLCGGLDGEKGSLELTETSNISYDNSRISLNMLTLKKQSLSSEGYVKISKLFDDEDISFALLCGFAQDDIEIFSDSIKDSFVAIGDSHNVFFNSDKFTLDNFDLYSLPCGSVFSLSLTRISDGISLSLTGAIADIESTAGDITELVKKLVEVCVLSSDTRVIAINNFSDTVHLDFLDQTKELITVVTSGGINLYASSTGLSNTYLNSDALGSEISSCTVGFKLSF